MEREGHMIVPRRSLRLATGALLVAVMAGCQQDSQPSSAPASTTSTVAPTTTTPPVTDAERAWAAGVTKLRERMDETFHEANVILTQAKLREYIRTGRSCAPRLARLGPATERLEKAAASAARACRNYARAAAVYQRAAPLVAVGSGETGDLLKDLQDAVEHSGNGSNGLRQAEFQAKVALD
jgi:hypothetical protein